MSSLSFIFTLTTVVMFVVGAAVGSFLNVVLYRTLRHEQWIKGRSKCDHCGKPLPWYHNIPLLSYAVLNGRSACCDKPLSISHPVVEFLTAILFVWWYWGGWLFFHLTQAPFQLLQPLFWLAVGLVLLIIVVVDWKYLIIPDEATVALTALTLAYRLALTLSGVMQVGDFVRTVIAAFVAVLFFLALWVGTKGRGMGFGDVKLVFPLVLLMGWPKMLVGLFMAFIVGAVIGVALILSRRHKLKQPLPFGPFLVAGTVIGLVWGQLLLDWYWQLLV